MSQILLSDWTLVAFKQREEERRKREQNEMAPLPPAEAAPRANETLRSEWTIAVLQKRFAALEQRLAALEQREEARRQFELREAAARTRQKEEQDQPPLATSTTIVALQKSFAALEQKLVALEQKEEARRQSELREAAARIRQKEEQKEALLATPTIVAPSQGNEPRRGIDQPGLLQPEVEPREPGPLAHTDAQWLERNVSETARDREGKGDRIEIRPARRGGIVFAMLYRFVSIMITASIAAAIGFGIGVYVVPIEKAAQFHSFVNRALDGVSLPKKR